ncbi:MAG: type II CRISPR RNA-guided endonuclease Cas9 [Cyclobacteriaceae bacterium]
MKKILGLDLGVASIGWSLIEESGSDTKILGMGSRIIPLSTDDKNEFSAGNAISKNQKRTIKRTQRKGYDRYQLRRANLIEKLKRLDMLPGEELIKLPSLELWSLRARAATERISSVELGRVLLHLNQKRGYKSSRADANLDKKETEYVAAVKNRYEQLRESRLTLGQHFYQQLQNNTQYRIKQQVYPREAYQAEFDCIIVEQQKYYPELLSSDAVQELRNEIIYYQRPLKSQKGLVSICEYEGFYFKKDVDGKAKTYFIGPKVAPRSSPVFQLSRIWETINNITIKNRLNERLTITLEQKRKLFELLDNTDRLSEAELFKALGIKKADGWSGDKLTAKGLHGNLTKASIAQFLPSDSPLLHLSIEVLDQGKDVHLVDKETGEVTESVKKQVVSPTIEAQPLYQLWHTIYSIPDQHICQKVLQEKLGIEPTIAAQLAAIDFTRQGFSNKSVKAMRKMLPYLMLGYGNTNATYLAGYAHAISATKDEILRRQLLTSIPNLPKNSLRQPVVEKILNQMINLINAIIDEKSGMVSRAEREQNQFEIRVELARELRQSREERNDASLALKKREKENEKIQARIEQEYGRYGIRATRNTIIKWRLFHEISNEESHLNAICIYCGQPFGIADALRGDNVDVEHIIPKSLLFDDSQSNKTLTHRKCNEDKGDRTAFDFMYQKGPQELSAYLNRIDSLYKAKIIGKRKRDKLLLPQSKIPKDFIERQIGETRYISRKAKEILEQVSYHVWATSGTVTAYLRKKWGWDDITMKLQLPKYRAINQTEFREFQTSDGQIHKEEVIKGWSKRDDNRHHAIDALVVACTQQGYIQRLNSLNSSRTRDAMREEVSSYNKRLSLLDNYLISKRPFSPGQVEEFVDQILVSYKAGKKVASRTKRVVKRGKSKHVAQTGLLVPRGALSEESVYGQIKTIEEKKPVKYLFEHPELIFKEYIRELVKARINQHNGDIKAALASLKKEPIYLDNERTRILEYGTCFKTETVIKYPLSTIKAKDLPFVVDQKVREILTARLAKFKNNEKEAFKNLDSDPVWFNEKSRIPIKTVRMLTGLASVRALREGIPDSGFVNPGNNHHLAIYEDTKSGKRIVYSCTFWHALERKMHGMALIMSDTSQVWSQILNHRADYTEGFLADLPGDGLKLVQSYQQNEMFLLGDYESELRSASFENRIQIGISKNLYRVQKLSVKSNGQMDLWFRHHLESEPDESAAARESKRCYNVQSIGALDKLNPKKVTVTLTGLVKGL